MLVLAFFSAIFGLSGPFLQKTFLDRLSGNWQFSKLRFEILNPFTEMQILLMSFTCLLLALALYQFVIYLGAKEALWMQRKLSQKLYNHTLSLQSEAWHGRAVGEVVSVYTTDIPGATILLEQSLPQGLGIFFPLFLGPIALINLLEVPSSTLIPTLIGVFLLNFFLAYRQSLFFYLFKKLAADRIGVVNEWIQNIRTLRVLGWVESFEKKIFELRKIETRNRISMLNNGQTMNGVASSLTFLLNVFLVWKMVNIHQQSITPGTLLTLLWIVGFFLTRPFRQMPWFFTFLFDAWTSIQRVSSILEIENRPSDIKISTANTTFLKKSLTETANFKYAISIKNLNLVGRDGEELLKNINFCIKNNEFIALVGEVGSGKSLLLSSLMGQTAIKFDSYSLFNEDVKKMDINEIQSYFSFVPQECFIISAKLRDNIAFTYETNEAHDSSIIKSLEDADFNLSIENTTEGLSTEIGERGVNLSGGQKQRVSLARVNENLGPIILLDDALSALDVDTEKRLIHNLFLNHWKNYTRVLVTHRLSVLPYVDRIVFLKNGRIASEGKLEELQKNSDFQDYILSLDKVEQKITSPKENILPPFTPSSRSIKNRNETDS